MAGADDRWSQGPDYVVNDDGSMDRIVPIPEHIREMAEKKGYKLKPDHIPADMVDYYNRLPEAGAKKTSDRRPKVQVHIHRK
jgi:hypothetical protein